MLLAAVMLSSCTVTSVTSYSFEQLKAAKYSLPGGLKKLLVVDAVETTVCNDSFYVEVGDTSYIPYVMRLSSMTSALLYDGINRSGYVDVDLYSKTVAHRVLAKDACDLMKKTGTDAIVALRKCDVSARRVVNGDQDEYVEAVMKSRAVIIDSLGGMRMLHERQDTLKLVADGVDVAVYPGYREAYYMLSEQVAQNMIGDIVPAWTRVHRRTMRSGNKVMMGGNRWVENGQWERAKDLYYKVYNEADGAERARAAYNIGLYYEQKDDPVQAGMWFSKCMDMIAGDARLKEKMSDELEQAEIMFGYQLERQAEKERLERQMAR